MKWAKKQMCVTIYFYLWRRLWQGFFDNTTLVYCVSLPGILDPVGKLANNKSQHRWCYYIKEFLHVYKTNALIHQVLLGQKRTNFVSTFFSEFNRTTKLKSLWWTLWCIVCKKREILNFFNFKIIKIVQ